MIKVSLIIPCYNVEEWVSRCISSIMAQTIRLAALEIICVDDCSTDNTLDILLKWEEKYPENIIVVKSPQNMRQGQARNIGLEYATAEWIAFIDSDDWIEPTYFEKLLKAAENGDFDLIACGYDRDFSKEYSLFEEQSDSIVNFVGSIAEDERRQYIIQPPFLYSPWAKIIRKSFLLENELFFYPNLSYEDAAWGSLLLLYCDSFCTISDKLYHYFVNGESTILSRNSNHHLDCITMQEIVWQEYMRRGFLDRYYDELVMEHIYSAALAGLKASILRYEKPDYNYYLLLRELVVRRIGDYHTNPYIRAGRLQEVHMLMMKAFDVVLSREEFLTLANYLQKIGI